MKSLACIVGGAAIALLAAVPPAAAGPPEEVSGRMAFDEVADGLRKYHKETDPEKRLAWLQTLGATGDPRVALALVDAANNQNGDDLDCEAADILWWHYASPEAASRRGIANLQVLKAPRGSSFRPWWQKNEAELRRRANELPR
jgi:hypothetical protein